MSAVLLPKPTKIDVARYHRMIEAGIFGTDDHIELIEGVLLDNLPRTSLDYSAVNMLTRVFMESIPQERAEIAVRSAVTLGDLSEPEPDLLILRPRADGYRRALPTAADVLLLIEVADASLHYDRTIKAPLYARFGVAEYWIVNLQDGQLEVYREPGPRGYGSVSPMDRGLLLAPACFPDLHIDWGYVIG